MDLSRLRDSKWLPTMKSRIGKLIFYGLLEHENAEVASLLENLARNWREYVAGCEGFLTGEHRRGLYRHSVVWGDMVGIILGG